MGMQTMILDQARLARNALARTAAKRGGVM
jgi:hypothetical protein